MTVSVVIPTYNAVAYLRKALESVLEQSEPPFEVIVVDDGSTDDTFGMIQDHLDQIRYIRTNRLGPGGARNVGIEHARGEYIAFLDADDYWLPHKLKIQMEFFRNHPDIAMVFTDAEVFEGERILLNSIKAVPLFSGIIGEEKVLTDPFLKIMRQAFISMGSVVVTRGCLEQVGFFDSCLPVAEDRDLWLRIARIGKIAFLPMVTMRIRKHGNNTSADRILGLQCGNLVLERHCLNHPQYGSEARTQLAGRHRELAHLYWMQGNASKAQREFWIALRTSFTVKSLIYYLSALIPPLFSLFLTMKRKGAGNPIRDPQPAEE